MLQSLRAATRQGSRPSIVVCTMTGSMVAGGSGFSIWDVRYVFNIDYQTLFDDRLVAIVKLT